MANPVARLIRRWKYGPEVIVVSGLPRSGTSMMMKMLDATGLPIMTDEVRTADVDNPKGYYEFERVKDLEKDPDKSWVRAARGKVLKVISFLLKDLPPENFYRVIFMRRDLDEVLASQNKMLEHRQEANETEDERMKQLYLDHLAKVRVLVKNAPNLEMIEVRYKDAVSNGKLVARQVNEFLGGHLDEAKMAAVVDKELYRNRKEKIAPPG